MTQLDTIPSEKDEQLVTFETDELTAVCPFDFGGPDFYTLTIQYVPNEYGIESKSLKKYLESFRNDEITAEGLAQTIYTDIQQTISPSELYIRLEQSRRGGIEETVEMGNDELCK